MAKRNTQAVAERLIKQHRPAMTKPEVLCIAPFKTGTTWLYYNLAHHPQVWAPLTKELNYLQAYDYPAHSIKNVLFNSHWTFQLIRDLLKQRIKCCLSPSKPDGFFDKNSRWLFNYAFGKRSYERYSSLFPVTPRLCIDISPSYYWLPEEVIREYQRYNPTAKVIIIIRNPIDRVWSNARMYLCRNEGRSVNQVDHSEFIWLFDYEYEIWHSYLQTIALWRTYFDDVCVSYYDTLVDKPGIFLANICHSLGIDPDRADKRFHIPINQGLEGNLPLELRHHLYRQYAEEIIEMADSGIPYASGWLDEHHTIVKGETVIS